MAQEVTWNEAVLQALAKRGGKGSPVQLYGFVVEIMEPDWLPERKIKHRIRSALNSLKEQGKVENVSGLWKLTKWF